MFPKTDIQSPIRDMAINVRTGDRNVGHDVFFFIINYSAITYCYSSTQSKNVFMGKIDSV